MESIPVVRNRPHLLLNTTYVAVEVTFVDFVSLVLTPDLMVCVRCGDLGASVSLSPFEWCNFLANLRLQGRFSLTEASPIGFSYLDVIRQNCM